MFKTIFNSYFYTMIESLRHRHLFLGTLHLLLIAIFFSKALVSVCMWKLVLLSVCRFVSISPFRLSFNKEVFNLQWYRSRDRRLRYLVGFFLLTLFSVFTSSNLSAWGQIVLLKTPFILLPFAFIHHPKLPAKQIELLYINFIGVVLLSSVGVLLYYAFSPAFYHDQINVGKSILTPLTHVKFSVLAAFAAITAGYYSIRQGRRNRLFLTAAAVFLVVFVHILAVRSGLLILYAIGGFLFLRHIYKSKGVLAALGTVILLSSLPVVAYFTLPSVKHKVHYMLYDLKRIKEGTEANYSDGERLRSLTIGMDIWKEHPIVGIGAGDLRTECNLRYESQFPDSTKKILPHNQYVLVGSSYGVIGLLFFLLCLIGLLTYKFDSTHILLQVMVVLIILYGMVEKPLDEYVFVTVFTLICCVEINRLKDKGGPHAI